MFSTVTLRPYIVWYVTCDAIGNETLASKKVMATSRQHAESLVGPAAESANAIEASNPNLNNED